MARSRRSTVGSSSLGSVDRRALKATSSRAAGGEWRLYFEEDATPYPWFSASLLLAVVITEVFNLHVDRINLGLRADNNSPQEPLNPKGRQGRLAGKGERPSFRGVTDRPNSFPKELTRTKIRESGVRKIGTRMVRAEGPRAPGRRGGPRARENVYGTRAVAFVQPGKKRHSTWLAKELAERGNEFFFVSGDVEAAIDRATVTFLNLAFAGPQKPPKTEEQKGRGSV